MIDLIKQFLPIETSHATYQLNKNIMRWREREDEKEDEKERWFRLNCLIQFFFH